MLIAAVQPAFCTRLTWAVYSRNFQRGRYPATGAGDSLMYRFLIPYNYNSSMKYPLVLALHGIGERGTNDTAQLSANYLATTWADSTSQAIYPCFVVAPQCPPSRGTPDTMMWVRTIATVVNQDANPITQPLSMVFRVVDSLIKLYPSIDTNRLYIIGLSMGGFGTWDAITRYPTKFAAAVPICGGGDSTKVGPIANLPLWVVHGQLDPAVNIASSRAMVNAIERRGKTWIRTISNTAWTTVQNGYPTRAQFITQVKASPTPQLIYTEYTNAYHDSWVTILNDTLLIPWVMSKSNAAGTGVVRTPSKTSTGSGRISGAATWLHVGRFDKEMPRSTGNLYNLSGKNMRAAGRMQGKGVYIGRVEE